MTINTVAGQADDRTIKLLAEWIAIDHDETRLQWPKYLVEAKELADYLYVIGDIETINNKCNSKLNIGGIIKWHFMVV